MATYEEGGLAFAPPDYDLLDDPVLARFVFYPRRDWRPAPPGAEDVSVAAEDGTLLSGRLYRADKAGPAVLFFHGNGEVASDYDDVAPLFRDVGASLLVADYRGYGRSGGAPSFPAMIRDAHAFHRAFVDGLEERGFTGRRFVMGRSLGGHAAVELAAHHPRGLAGLIVESGVTGVSRFVQYVGMKHGMEAAVELEARHLEKLRSIRIPALILHGAEDEVVPVEEAEFLHQVLSVGEKRLVVIPGAGHNDILWLGQEAYMRALRAFMAGR